MKTKGGVDRYILFDNSILGCIKTVSYLDPRGDDGQLKTVVILAGSGNLERGHPFLRNLLSGFNGQAQVTGLIIKRRKRCLKNYCSSAWCA